MSFVSKNWSILLALINIRMQPIPVKIVVVGDGAVGKTSLLCSYVHNKFPMEYQPTVFDSQTKTTNLDGRLVNLSLWDTAGQEEYASLRPLAYTNADVFLITFSVQNSQSLTNAIKKWYPDVKAACPRAVCFFVGNKIDLRKGGYSSVGYVQAANASRQIQSLGCTYSQCSALTQQGLSAVFQSSIRQVMRIRGFHQSSQPATVEEPWCLNCKLI